MTIGEMIKKRRTELGMTLEEVGKSVGVGKSTVRKWENGIIENMKLDKIAMLAKVLKLPPSAFIGEGEIALPDEKPAADDNELSEEEKIIMYLFEKVEPARREQTLTRIRTDLENRGLL